MTGDVLVGVDVGTTGVKAVAISADGRLLASASEEYALSTPQPGWAEQDPEDWWRAAESCLARLPQGHVGFSGQMHGLVVLDAEDRVLRPAILWNDQRTAAECAEIEARVGLERLIALTGNRALTGFTAPKLLWLRRHEAETYARIRHVLLPKDYVRLRLTGEHAIDVADASGTLLFDVAGRRWSDEVCAALDVPLEWLPPVHESTEIAGAGDQAAAALGVGIVHPGAVSVVLGTSGVVFAVLPSYAPDVEARVHVFCHAVPGTWHAMGVMLSAAGSFAWLRRVLGAGYGLLDEEAARWEPGAEGLLFAPYLVGRAHPPRRPRCAWCVHRPLASARPAARWHARRSKASPTGCATRSSSYASSESARRSGALRAAAPRATCGCASSPRCSASRSSGWSRRRDRRTAQRSSQACAQASSRTPPTPLDAACACATGSSPTPEWTAAYDRGYERFKLLYPNLRELEEKT